MASRIKRLTSGKSRRFSDYGFDLDLTYITPKIIAMGFPGERLEGLYRNHINKVARFFDDRHSDHYKIYNLCSERSYNPTKFHKRVATYPFRNGKPPPFELIRAFCEDLDEWLKADDQNVAGIHCHDGLGRTGVMICSYMLHGHFVDSTKDALEYFADARTQSARGVTIPSQQRYVQYYGYLLKNNLTYSPKTILMTSINFIGIPNIQGGTCVPIFSVTVQKVKIYTSNPYDHIKRTDSTAQLLLPQEIRLYGDIEIKFYYQSISKERMFRFSFNTSFVDMHTIQAHNPQLTQPTKFNEVTKQCDDVDTTTRVPKDSKVNPFTYRKDETQSKQFKKALKKAGKKAGVDITTGVTALFPRAHEVTSREDEKQNSVSTSSKLVSKPLDMGLTDLNDTDVIIFSQSELDTDIDKKYYPDNFQVYLCLSTATKSVDFSSDFYSEDNITNISNTDDEDSLEKSYVIV